MSAFVHPLVFRRRPAWLLALGVLAMALHLLAGSGLARAASATGSGDRFIAELCTSHGVVGIESSQDSSGSPVPANGVQDCCKLCAASGPLLAAGVSAAVASAPTLAVPPDALAFAQPIPDAWTAHAPRGPPD